MNASLTREFLQSVVVGCLWTGCLWAAGAAAADPSLDLTVEAGKHNRTNTPVRVLVDLPDGAKTVTLTGADGTRLPAQLTAPGLLNDSAKAKRELHFILPKLAAGESLRLSATFSDRAPTEAAFSWHDKRGEYVELTCAGRPVVRYMCRPPDPKNVEETCKVFHHVYDPAGTRFVTKGPGGKYTHHRGLFFEYCNITYGNGRANNWGCSTNWQAHARCLAREAGPVLGRHQVAVDWHAGKTVFAKERRELCVFHVPDGTLIEWTTHLATTGGKVRLDGNAAARRLPISCRPGSGREDQRPDLFHSPRRADQAGPSPWQRPQPGLGCHELRPGREPLLGRLPRQAGESQAG